MVSESVVSAKAMSAVVCVGAAPMSAVVSEAAIAAEAMPAMPTMHTVATVVCVGTAAVPTVVSVAGMATVGTASVATVICVGIAAMTTMVYVATPHGGAPHGGAAGVERHPEPQLKPRRYWLVRHVVHGLVGHWLVRGRGHGEGGEVGHAVLEAGHGHQGRLHGVE